MNGRRSLDPSSNKPLNINIFYNINSKNVTNNQEALSHPVTSRANQNPYQQINNNTKIQVQHKNLSKPRKKKHSTNADGQGDSKTERLGKKTLNNSICSGFTAQASSKRGFDRNLMVGEDIGNIREHDNDNEKKINDLLQVFSEGKIDKNKLTKQILGIFQRKSKTDQDPKNKKFSKKKKSESTIFGTMTPKTVQIKRLNSANQNIKNVMSLHKTRKNQTRSERGSFYYHSKDFIEKQIMDKLVESKAINSSLFLNAEQDQKIIPVDRANDVQTSYSITLLKENLQNCRKNRDKSSNRDELAKMRIQDMMAMRIQRAWKKYKTKCLIQDRIRRETIHTSSQNSFINKMECFSGKNSDHLQNFLSEELSRKFVMRESEKAKVEELKDHEMKKWNQIMSYVQTNIENKHLSPNECLTNIIEYFENVKEKVQKQLQLEGQGKKRIDRSRQITEFTNKVFSSELHNKQINDLQKDSNQDDNDGEKELDSNEEQLYADYVLSENGGEVFIPTTKLSVQGSLRNTNNGYLQIGKHNHQNLSFEIVESALLRYQKKITYQHQQNLRTLDFNSPNFLEEKKKIEKKFKETKSELNRILKNLNKGYLEAKSILEKEMFLDSEESNRNYGIGNDVKMLQKCKSDNYLLKTAMNYKQYIEKKQKSVLKQLNIELIRKRKISKISQYDSIDHEQDESEGSLEPQLKQVLISQLDQDEDMNKSEKFEYIEHAEEGEGYLVNSLKGQIKFEDKIVSQEFVKYDKNGREKEEGQNWVSGLKEDIANSQDELNLIENNKINEIRGKLKSISIEDKEDIFQFLFIDLSLELITEFQSDSRVYESIKNYVKKRNRLSSIPKGIKTSLNSAKEYVSLLNSSIQEYFSSLFLKHIGVPMGPTAVEMLRYMREDDSGEDPDDVDINSIPLILPVSVFEKVETGLTIEYPKYHDDEIREASRVKFLKSLEHIHHKALFDCLNESLDMQRPFGIWGMPFPWKTTHKHSKQKPQEKNKKFEKLKDGCSKVIQCCSYMCGILVDKQESVFANNKVSEHYVQQIRQDRISKMIQNDLIEGEERWCFHDDEETEIVIQISRVLLNSLLNQCSKEMLKV